MYARLDCSTIHNFTKQRRLDLDVTLNAGKVDFCYTASNASMG